MTEYLLYDQLGDVIFFLPGNWMAHQMANGKLCLRSLQALRPCLVVRYLTLIGHLKCSLMHAPGVLLFEYLLHHQLPRASYPRLLEWREVRRASGLPDPFYCLFCHRNSIIKILSRLVLEVNRLQWKSWLNHYLHFTNRRLNFSLPSEKFEPD